MKNKESAKSRRQRYKTELIKQIEQQRLDVADANQQWLNKMYYVDSGWEKVSRHPKLTAFSIGLVAVYIWRHPLPFVRVSRKMLSTLYFLHPVYRLFQR